MDETNTWPGSRAIRLHRHQRVHDAPINNHKLSLGNETKQGVRGAVGREGE
jgi:hypothetical protein